jgi:hypothetical protein
MPKELTLAEHAEMWWQERGNIVPVRDTIEWKIMYEKWIEFAFSGFEK